MAAAINARMAAPAMERRVNFMDKTFTRTRRPSGRAPGSRKFDVMILQRKRADSLARRTEERVENRRPCDADRRLADATPEAATRHDDRFDLRHLGDAHRVVRIEILLLDASVLDRTLLIEQGRQTIDERACYLPLNLRWVDRIPGIGRRNDAMDLNLAVADNGNFGRPRRRSCRMTSFARFRDEHLARGAFPIRFFPPPHLGRRDAWDVPSSACA